MVQYCQDTGTDEMGFGSNYIFANKIGADNSVVNSNTTALKVYMKKFLSPTGTIYAEVYNSAGVLQHEYDSMDIDDLQEDITPETFTGGPGESYQIQAGDKVGIRCGVLGGSGVPVMTRNPSLSDVDWEREEYNGTSWTTYNTQSMRMCLTGDIPPAISAKIFSSPNSKSNVIIIPREIK